MDGLSLIVYIYFIFLVPGNFAQLCDFIGKSGDVLTKNASHLDNVLATLDIQQHSLGVLGILWVIAYQAWAAYWYYITDWETFLSIFVSKYNIDKYTIPVYSIGLGSNENIKIC